MLSGPSSFSELVQWVIISVLFTESAAGCENGPEAQPGKGTEIAGAEAEFDVGAPELLTQGTIPQSYRQRPPSAGARFWLDSGSVLLALFTDGPVPAAVNQSAGQEKEPQLHD